MNTPSLVSFTGADDRVDLKDLAALSHQYPQIEWALLYYPEREGSARNPSTPWRETFLARSDLFEHRAAHLCGTQVFEELLNPATRSQRLDDLVRYSRVQVNINARKVIFSAEQVLEVYSVLRNAGITTILQYHPDSKELITDYLESLEDVSACTVLFDGSKGKGVVPEDWPAPLTLGKDAEVYCGYAGGLGPDTLEDILRKVQTITAKRSYWIDMESGIRTDNEFDLDKCKRVLEITYR